MMKLKHLLMAILLLPLCALAAEKTLVVELTSGQTASYQLQDKPVLTMTGTQMNISTATVQTVYERSNVKHFYFTESPTGIKELQATALMFKQTDADHLEIDGLPQDERVTVCDVAGKQTGSISRSGNKTVVSLSGLPKGIYLIKAGNCQTIKFTKK